MAKNSRSKSDPAQKDQANDQQKKQAKKEAKTMLAIEQVKSSLEKARNKLAKAQARVEARSTHLHNLEAKLTAARSTSPSTPVPAETQAPDSGFDHQGEQTDTLEPATNPEVPSTSSSDGENHASAAPAHTESQTASDSSAPETGDGNTQAATPAQVAAMNPAASDQGNSETPSTNTSAGTPAKTTPRPRVTRARTTTPRRAPAKPSTTAAPKSSTSSTPARRTSTRKSASTPKTPPEASNGNKSE